MNTILRTAAALAAVAVLTRAAVADPALHVGSMADVRQNVYGVAPEGGEAVKRRGDAVVFQESLKTLEDSGALIKFVDDSRLALGEKSDVLIDEFVFDPQKVQGNAVIRISVGTLRWVTGAMPKGGTVIKTPTATLTLRGTDVIVHVHPDGTTDTMVNEGEVEAHNDLTGDQTDLRPGDGATLGNGGNADYQDDDPFGGPASDGNDNTPEHRRGDFIHHPTPRQKSQSASSEPDDDNNCGGICN